MSITARIKDLSILIIDDNAYMANLARQALKGAGAQLVSIASRTDSALEMLQSTKPDVTIVSLEFDDCLTGLDLISMIRTGNDVVDRTAPIIVMSENASRTNVMAVRDLGVHAFVRRPFSAQELSSHVVMATLDRRSFVQKKSYTGPDRRTRNSGDYDGPERRAAKNEYNGSERRKPVQKVDMSEDEKVSI